MDNKNKHNAPIKKLTPELMQEYANGELSARMQHEVEKFLLNNPFEAEAMEGFIAEGSNDLRLKELEGRLDNLIAEKEKPKTNHWKALMAYAASFILLLIATISIVYFYGGSEQDKPISLEQKDILPLDSQNESEPNPANPPTKSSEGFIKSIHEDRNEISSDISENNARNEESTIYNQLKGKTPGVIVESEKKDKRLSLRGASSMSNNNKPMIILDGIVMTDSALKQLNPQLIDSVDVLSGAKASALYGSRASNGVILLSSTTDHNKKDSINNQQLNLAMVGKSAEDKRESMIRKEAVKEQDGVRVKEKNSEKKAASKLSDQIALSQQSAEDELEETELEAINSQFKITGTVMDASTNKPLAGANIYSQENSKSTNSDINGEFEIMTYEGETFSVNYMGLRSVDFTVQSAETNISIKLEPDQAQLSEVVIIARGEENGSDTYKAAEPINGKKAYKQYLESALEYPQSALESETEGNVKLKLTISSTGQITSIKVTKSLSQDCDKEAIRLIQEGPRWKPAIKNGDYIESTITIKVPFHLNK